MLSALIFGFLPTFSQASKDGQSFYNRDKKQVSGQLKSTNTTLSLLKGLNSGGQKYLEPVQWYPRPQDVNYHSSTLSSKIFAKNYDDELFGENILEMNPKQIKQADFLRKTFSGDELDLGEPVIGSYEEPWIDDYNRSYTTRISFDHSLTSHSFKSTKFPLLTEDDGEECDYDGDTDDSRPQPLPTGIKKKPTCQIL